MYAAERHGRLRLRNTFACSPVGMHRARTARPTLTRRVPYPGSGIALRFSVDEAAHAIEEATGVDADKSGVIRAVLRSLVDSAEAEVDKVRSKLEAEVDKVKLEAEVDKVRSKLEAEVDKVKLEAEVDKVRSKLEAEVEKVRAVKLEAEVEKVSVVKQAEVEKVSVVKQAEVEKITLEAEVEKIKMKAEMDNKDLKHQLLDAMIELMLINGCLNARGVIETLQRKLLGKLLPIGEDRREWTRTKKWTAILKESDNQELLACLQICIPPPLENGPDAVAKRITSLYGHLSGFLHVQLSSRAVDIVEGDAVNQDEAAMLICMAEAIPVRYTHRYSLASAAGRSVDEAGLEPSNGKEGSSGDEGSNSSSSSSSSSSRGQQ